MFPIKNVIKLQSDKYEEKKLQNYNLKSNKIQF